MNTNNVYPLKKFFSDFWLLLDGNRAKFVSLISLTFTAGLFGYISTYFLGRIVDFFIGYDSGESLHTFYLYTFLIISLGSTAVLIRQNAKLSVLKIGAEMRRKTRLAAMSKLVDLELKWHESQSTGAKIQKINTGSQNVYDFMRLIPNEGNDLITGVAGSTVIFALLSWKYALFGAVYFTIFLIMHAEFIKRKSKWQEQISKINEKLSGKVHESASNILAVKSMGLKRNITTSMKTYEDELYNTWLAGRSLDAKKSQIFNIFSLMGYTIFLLMIGFDAAHGIIEAATIFVFANYFDKLKRATDVIQNSNDRFVEIKSGIGRVMSILDEKTIEREAKYLLEVPIDWKEISIDNVSFKYKDKWVLRNLNLKIRRGEKIGVVGRSGCGKSTICKVLLGLYQPQEGTIRIDGKSLQEYKQSSINSRIGVVLQESEVFNTTLSENISVSDIKQDKSRVTNVCKVAELKDILKKLPDGLDTIIGEKGYKLSGGERQRVGIARAIYAQTSAIILDEATSHLDSKTEKNIQDNLSKHLKGRTLLVIAHRLSTLKNMDRIVFMRSGKIDEEGSFDELIAKKGQFYELYKTQKSSH